MRPLLPVLFLAACSTKTTASASSTSTIGDATPGTSSAPTAFYVKAGVGFFAEKRLAACLDNDLSFLRREDADAFLESVKPVKDDETQTFFPNGCARTMKDRKPLATCVSQAKNKSGELLGTHTQSFYEFEMLDGDSQMRKCISAGDKWDAVSHESSEYLRAESDARLRKDEAKLKQLQKQLGQ